MKPSRHIKNVLGFKDVPVYDGNIMQEWSLEVADKEAVILHLRYVCENGDARSNYEFKDRSGRRICLHKSKFIKYVDPFESGTCYLILRTSEGGDNIRYFIWQKTGTKK